MGEIKIFVAVLLLLVLGAQGVFAVPALDVEKVDKGSVIISELGNPAMFDFFIRNRGTEDNFEIYSLVGMRMSPKGTFELPTGRKKIEVTVFADEEILKNQSGFFTFEYQIKGQNSGIFKDTLTVKIVSLKDAVDVFVNPLVPGDKEAKIIVENLGNIKIDELDIKIESELFEFDKKVSLEPLGEDSFLVELDAVKLANLIAGSYELDVFMKLGEVEVEKKGELVYLEEEILKSESFSEGFLIRKKSVRKINEGNVPVRAEIEIRKDVLTRLFTTYAVEPASVERRGLFVDYVWRRDLGPGESLDVTGTTNYTFPFLIIVFIAVIGFLARFYFLTDLNFRKRVSFVRTKGGEFALKVVLRVRARKPVDDVKIFDTLPGMTKLYEGYGRRPDTVDADSRKLQWEIGAMNAGEERVFSYVIYSKLRVVGRFELPAARAVYELGGEKKSIASNKTYFVSEAGSSEFG